MLKMSSAVVDAKTVTVIVVRAMVGGSNEADPPRAVRLHYSMDGELLAYFDPLAGPPDARIQSDIMRFASIDQPAVFREVDR
ncbi:hypothetical protein [Burkholderia stagnalis]|uniref:hypothetical protein n=1 Tax=Burkholderia stagnalis TaxID=1503054 RepID=UPI000758E905|nr:hypothetical protein [Burkholderia stagnalis]KVX62747.1 hypothetical protein WT33_15845 [Burkholderia stagnalis]